MPDTLDSNQNCRTPLNPQRNCGYTIFDDFLCVDDALSIKSCVESLDNFKRHEEYFFSQHDAALVRRDVHGASVGLMTDELRRLYESGKAIIEEEYRSLVSSRFTILVHRMSNGQLVGIHNDSPNHDRGRMENYRLMLYFDLDYRDEYGGMLFLFSEKSEASLLDAVRPNFNSAVLLPLTDFSYHAVGRVNEGVRYSLVVSYWAYAVLEREASEFSVVASVISHFLDCGLDRLLHSNTTLLDHLHGTYRMLATWEAGFDIRVAGLLHSAFGRVASEVAHSGVDRDYLEALCGRTILDLVDRFSVFDIDAYPDLTGSRKDADLFLIGLANEIEQAETSDDIERVRSLMRRATFSTELQREIAAAELGLREAYILDQGRGSQKD